MKNFWLENFICPKTAFLSKVSQESRKQLSPSVNSIPKHATIHTLYCLQKAERLHAELSTLFYSYETWLTYLQIAAGKN